MNKKLKRVLALVCCLTTFPLTACTKEDSTGSSVSSSSVEQTTEETATVVWTASGAEKFMRDADCKAHWDNQALKISAFRNEREAAQIMISAGEEGAYTVSLSDLTSANGDVLSKDSFAVYHEKYIQIDTIYDTGVETPAGEYPDALLPYENAVRYDENVVQEGKNQGIWVELMASKTQAAGTYTGTFEVKFAGKTYAVPVEVTVYDYTLSDEAQSITCFEGLYSEIAYGELDASVEMMEAYYDFFLDHRVTIRSLPTASALQDGYDISDVDEFLEKAVEADADPRCTLFTIPTTSGSNPADYGITDTPYLLGVESYKEWVMELALKSLEVGKSLFSKAYTYMTFCDEYDDIQRFPDGAARAYHNYTLINLCGEEVIEWMKSGKTSTIYGRSRTFTKPEDMSQEEFEGLLAEISDGIKGIRHILTGGSLTLLESYCTEKGYKAPAVSFVPTIDKFNSESSRDALQAYAEKSGGEVWTYTCVNPSNPYPTYHLEDALVSARLLGWMMYDYDVVGNLYWRTILYSYVGYPSSSDKFIVEDCYGEPLRYPTMNGDGWLVYPGRQYDVYGPVASMRLKAICDGNEDYDLLYALEEYARQRGVSETEFDTVLKYLSSDMYVAGDTRVDYAGDPIEGLYKNRDILGQLLALASNTGTVVENIRKSGNNVVVTLSAPEGVTVTANGKALTAKSTKDGICKYEAKMQLSSKKNTFSLTAEKDGKTYETSLELGVEAKVIGAKKLQGLTSAYIGTTTSTEALDTQDKVSVLKVTASDTSGASSVKLDLTSFAISAPYTSLTCKIYNYGEATSLIIRGKSVNGRLYNELAKITLKSGWNEVKLSLLALQLSNGEILDSLRFDVENNATYAFGELMLEE